MPLRNTETMQVHLVDINATVIPGAHAVLTLGRLGPLPAERLVVPGNVTLLKRHRVRPQPPPESVWQDLRQNWLSNREDSSYTNILADFLRGLA